MDERTRMLAETMESIPRDSKHDPAYPTTLPTDGTNIIYAGLTKMEVISAMLLSGYVAKEGVIFVTESTIKKCVTHSKRLLEILDEERQT